SRGGIVPLLRAARPLAVSGALAPGLRVGRVPRRLRRWLLPFRPGGRAGTRGPGPEGEALPHGRDRLGGDRVTRVRLLGVLSAALALAACEGNSPWQRMTAQEKLLPYEVEM